MAVIWLAIKVDLKWKKKKERKKERKRKEVVTIWPVHRHSRFYPTLYRTRADHLGVFLFFLLLLLPYSHLHFDLRIKPLRIERAGSLLQEEEMMNDSSLDLFQSRPSTHSLNTCVPFFYTLPEVRKRNIVQGSGSGSVIPDSRRAVWVPRSLIHLP